MIRDFDGYDEDLQAVATDDKALDTLKTGREKRAAAATLVDEGKKTAAVPIVKEALADAHLALEMDRMGASARRAQAVHQFLISQGVAESRLNWEGYGEGRPVSDNDTEEGRQRNRRVDLVIQDAP